MLSLNQIIQGNCLKVLEGLPDNSVDAVITDPPYSSGGFTRSDKTKSTTGKYIQSGTQKVYPDFGGDNRDVRSWAMWCTLWISECFRVMRDGGYFMMFSDWRQLPTASDVFQAGGFVWRGVIVWNKGFGTRAPHKGYFRHQCEYILWGSKNGLPKREDAGPFFGCFNIPIKPQEKFHLTGKPIELMRELVSVIPKGSTILDPFAGSGTTLVAAKELGYNFIGIEQEQVYVDIAKNRLDNVAELCSCAIAAEVKDEAV